MLLELPSSRELCDFPPPLPSIKSPESDFPKTFLPSVWHAPSAVMAHSVASVTSRTHVPLNGGNLVAGGRQEIPDVMLMLTVQVRNHH